MRLCRKNYEQIEKIVDEMYEDLDFAEIPVDVFKLCQKLQINLDSKFGELCADTEHF